jgi:hypothetical protein
MATEMPEPPRWTLARERLNALYRCRADIGTLPAGPPTWRGRAGLKVVLVMRRSLFWLLPQLDRFHACTIETAEEQLQALEDLAVAYGRMDAALGRLLAEFARRHRELENEVARLRTELHEMAGNRDGWGR